MGGLAEYTTYYFQVYAGDATGLDVNFFTPAPVTSTLIKRTWRLPRPSPAAQLIKLTKAAAEGA